MICRDSLAILEKELVNQFEILPFSNSDRIKEYYPFDLERENLFSILLLYALIYWGGSSSNKLIAERFRHIKCLAPEINDISTILEYLDSFESDSDFWKKYEVKMGGRIDACLRELAIYLDDHLCEYPGTSDKERFFLWLQDKDVYQIGRYGFNFSVKAIQIFKQLIGLNTPSVNGFHVAYLESFFEQKYDHFTCLHFFEIVGQRLDCDMTYLSMQVDLLMIEVQKDIKRDVARRLSENAQKRREVLQKAKEIISSKKYKEIMSNPYYRNRYEKHLIILREANIDPDKYRDIYF